jgi:signal transduction histidine kinase
LTLLIGAWILIDEDATRAAGNLRFIDLRQATGYTRIASKASQWPEAVANQAFYYARLFGTNKEILLYAAIAGFGVLMVALAISNATSTPKDKSNEIVDLLKQEKEKAEQLAKLKSEFLNQVSHELRTPLAVILGYLECMTDGLYGEIESKHREILQAVTKQSSHLKDMIDQILIFSRLESSKQPLRIEEFSVPKLFMDLRDTFDFLCKQKGIAIAWNISRDLPALTSDPERFREIASNLLQNALKYTDAGSINVSVVHRPQSDSVALEVADTGLGIPESYVSTIFEPFIQVHKTSTENSRGGIGLGLSIVKKHVEQLRGAIHVESQVGNGTTFRIILPRVHKIRKDRRKYSLGLLRPPFFSRNRADAHAQAAPTAGGRKPRTISEAIP